MRRGLLGAFLLAAFGYLGGGTPVAMPKTAPPPNLALAQPAFCVGNRRTYRHFNQCWQVNAHRTRKAASYCSRIC